MFAENITKLYNQMSISIKIGSEYTSRITVDKNKTALYIGSGDIEVLSTPSMIALMENAAMNSVASQLPENCTTVGGYIETNHIKPSKVGEKIFATAVLINVENKKLTFNIKAFQETGELIGEGTHIRYIINKDTFISKL